MANSKQKLDVEFGADSEKSGVKQKNTKIAAWVTLVVVGLVLIGLALGLGLHFALDDDSSNDVTLSTCADFEWGEIPSSTNGEVFLGQPCISDTQQPQCPDGYETPPLIIMSLDGFRGSYLDRGLNPVISQLATCGAHTQQLKPVFPSNTFPNHYSIMTGLFPESHGIIDNTMFDPVQMKEFSSAVSAQPGFQNFWQGEPFWNTVMKANKSAATVFWGGSDAAIGGQNPDTCYKYNEAVPFEARVEEILRLLDLPVSERPDFIASYYHQPDQSAHYMGIYDDNWFSGNLSHVDQVAGRLLDGLIERGILECVNLILLADHGMGPITSSRVVNLYEDLDTDSLLVYDGPLGRISGKHQRDQEGNIVDKEVETPVQEILHTLECTPPPTQDPDAECLTLNDLYIWYAKGQVKEDLPVRYHYSNHVRIEDVIITMNEQWEASRWDQHPAWQFEGADHGWDPRHPDMGAIFVGHGRDIKTELPLEPFNNIEIHNFMAALLQIEPAPNNGTIDSLWHLLRNPPLPVGAPPPSDVYTHPEYPETEELDQRRAASDCTCDDLEDITETPVDELDSQLSLSRSEQSSAEYRHLLRGEPTIMSSSELKVLQLTQSEYITGYSVALSMPLWSAYTLSISQIGSAPITGCHRPDVRLQPEQSLQCSEYNVDGIQPGYLYPASFSSSGVADIQMDSYISTNIAPMYPGFATGIWAKLLSLIHEYRVKYNEVNVMTGPVFDYNSDAKADGLDQILQHKMSQNITLSIPTHYYAVLMRCTAATVSLVDCEDEDVDVLSLIIPHKPEIRQCQTTYMEHELMSYLSTHMARLHDIELITGLRFIPDMHSNFRSRIVSSYRMELWERPSWMDEEQTEPVQCPSGDDVPLLLISLDGFRPDYFERNLSPVLSELKRRGATTSFMESVFPTKTFPNHHSIATGLFPENHGIIDNDMYDDVIDEIFFLGSETSADTRWWQGEPIWNTVEKANRTARTMFWPGGDVEIGGQYPSACVKYNGNVPYGGRIDTVLNWLDGSDGDRADFVTLYFSKVDHEGHEGGALGHQVNEAIPYVDGYIGDLMDGLYRRGLDNCVNIIITSDHGMADISCERNFQMVNYLGEEAMQNTYFFGGPSGRISNEYYRADIDTMEPVEPENVVPQDEILASLECQEDQMRSYNKHTLPKRLHHTAHHRIEDTFVIVDETYSVDGFEAWCGMAANHGWDPTIESMQAIFLGYGPAFMAEVEVEPFENIELYNLMTEILSLTPAPNDGMQGSLHHLLQNPSPLPPQEQFVQPLPLTFPDDLEEYEQRADLVSSGCVCAPPDDILTYDQQLDIADNRHPDLELVHAPQGLPLHTDDTFQYSVAHHEDYISGYNIQLHTPEWVVLVINASVEVVPHDIQCLRPDVRFLSPDVATCTDYQSNLSSYVPGHLIPPRFMRDVDHVMDAMVLTQVVPMLPTFQTMLWSRVWEHIHNISQSGGDMQAIVGPLYDNDNDNYRDGEEIIQRLNGTSIAIPTHFYIVLLRCDGAADCSDEMNYNVMSYVIPHIPEVSNCMSIDAFLWDNRVRLRDVERLTGLDFFTHDVTQLGIQAKVRLPRERW